MTGDLKMSVSQKILLSVLSGVQDNNIKFKDLQKLLESYGFSCRVKGDHFIYWKDEIINLQPNGNKAKPYQVKQVRNMILKYKLGGM